MCGIAGIISYQPTLLSVHRLQQMTDALAHRGPDGAAHWINDDKNVGFGHRRLAIICPGPTGAQPMHYAGRYTIVYNGEIYNYIELRNQLQQKGYRFTTASDTEVILAAYDCYKSDCLQQLDGMFAFAIWDQQEQKLFAARDRFGEKPFYYFIDDQQLVFASEMKALWAVGIKKEMDERMLYNYFTLGYTQNPANASETFYKDIYKLPARSFITYQKQLVTTQYWDIKPVQISNHIEKFTALFDDSVRKRLRSDVPIGTSLSGGLDSSSIVATINQPSLKTFSAVFPGFKKDESAYIKQLNTNNYQVQPDVQRLVNDFEKICYHQEEPFQSASIAAQFYVYELARQHQVPVLLDGQGADETLAGYPKYQQAGWKTTLASHFPRLAGWYLMKQHQPPVDLAHDFKAEYGQSYYQLPRTDGLNNMLYYNTFVNGLEELLRYADRNSMAHGVEVRLPFLQHNLVEFIFSVPAHYKIRDGYTKWLLRKSMEDRLPASIVWRTDKVGFEPPQQQWMQHPPLQEYIQEGKKVLVQKGILQKDALQKKIQPLDAHAAENYDWRYLVAGWLLR